MSKTSSAMNYDTFDVDLCDRTHYDNTRKILRYRYRNQDKDKNFRKMKKEIDYYFEEQHQWHDDSMEHYESYNDNEYVEYIPDYVDDYSELSDLSDKHEYDLDDNGKIYEYTPFLLDIHICMTDELY